MLQAFGFARRRSTSVTTAPHVMAAKCKGVPQTRLRSWSLVLQRRWTNLDISTLSETPANWTNVPLTKRTRTQKEKKPSSKCRQWEYNSTNEKHVAWHGQHASKHYLDQSPCQFTLLGTTISPTKALLNIASPGGIHQFPEGSFINISRHFPMSSSCRVLNPPQLFLEVEHPNQHHDAPPTAAPSLM